MSPLADRDVTWAYRRYFPLLHAKCRRMLRDPHEALDVAQETFTRLWKLRMDLDDTNLVSGWLYTTSTRLAVDRLRRARRFADATAADVEGASLPDRIVAARDGLERVAAALTTEELTLLVLWRIDGLEQAEIAAITGLGERTVRRRLRAAQDSLSRLEGADG